MSSSYEKYTEWLTYDEDTKIELSEIDSEKEIEDRFYQELTFGTGGLRGLMGAGTNRLNQYTIKKTSYGVGKMLVDKKENPKIAIAYDTRNGSLEFANYAADVFTFLGIKTFLFEECMPTPILSFAVRLLECDAGIVITASHNPKEYNGYKVYNNQGGQLVPEEAAEVMNYMKLYPDFDLIKNIQRDESLFESIGNQMVDQFIQAIPRKSSKESKLKVVYSALHGTGGKPIHKILESFDVFVVEEQELPDGDFSTVSSPNPENRESLSLAIRKAKEVDADVVLATDPDCDRLGVAVKHRGKYEILTGNQLGALFVDYLTANHSLGPAKMIIKTIVTSELGANIAKKRDFHSMDTLTGFKYIGEKINLLEKESRENKFLFGYEESYGFLFGTHTRDKDAVSAAWLFCEIAALYAEKGLTMLDQLNELYNEFGFYLDDLDSITIQGKEGVSQIYSLMEKARTWGNELVSEIDEVKDYLLGMDKLPSENVLKFILKDGSWFAIRPSGTEPKVKFYYSIQAINQNAASVKLDKLKKELEVQLNIQLPNQA